jgi:tetratricopeptide (TPR) repeat protein
VAAQSLLFTGRFDRARTLLEGLEAIEHTRPAPEPAALGWIRFARMSGALWLDVDVDAALELAAGSIASFREAGDPQGLLFAIAYHGVCLSFLGSFERAEQELGEALTTSRRLGARFVEILAQLFLAPAVAHRGEGLSALMLLTEVQRSSAELGLRVMEGLAQRALAQGWLLAGDVEAALRCAESAVDLTAGAQPFQAEALATLAHVRARRGEQAEALALAREAMAILGDLGSIGPMEAGVRLVHVEALRAAGDEEGVRAALAAARDRLVARAARIREPELQRSFLEEVHTHRKTFALAGKWLSAW